MNDQYARDLADRAAGNSLANLHAAIENFQDKMNIWINTYLAALDSPHYQDDLKPPLTVAQAAAALNISETMVRELVLQGKLAKVDGLGTAVRIPQAEIARMLTQQEMTNAS